LGILDLSPIQNLILGRDHPAKRCSGFQKYVKDMRWRGVIPAVCSKNDVENAREGFSRSGSVLKLGGFTVFKANWSPKPTNIREIAAELNLGLELRHAVWSTRARIWRQRFGFSADWAWSERNARLNVARSGGQTSAKS